MMEGSYRAVTKRIPKEIRVIVLMVKGLRDGYHRDTRGAERRRLPALLDRLNDAIDLRFDRIADSLFQHVARVCGRRRK